MLTAFFMLSSYCFAQTETKARVRIPENEKLSKWSRRPIVTKLSLKGANSKLSI
ncbi:hypothetical protein [Pedobacter sp. PACM 27299]|uniref:hypothetical protein n=1 Tax=Pedobacter sp. PACM 27299 TaxID=1727164 RepID=UPI000AE33B2F|nr:hypothetical protein [Pedobacter sp. PACM 27299]